MNFFLKGLFTSEKIHIFALLFLIVYARVHYLLTSYIIRQYHTYTMSGSLIYRFIRVFIAAYIYAVLTAAL